MIVRPYAFFIGRLERDFAHARAAIRAAVEHEAGIACLWSDSDHQTNVASVRESTRLLIKGAAFVVADLTLGVESPHGENPSRAHEIGMSIAYERPLMLSSQEPRRYPYFSIGDMQMTFWETEGQLHESVRNRIRAMRGVLARFVFNHHLPERFPGYRPLIGAPTFVYESSQVTSGRGRPSRAASAKPPMGACVYCLSTAALRDDQILLRGRSLYLCAPRGQLVEGFLAVAPYTCIGALSRLPRESLGELERATAIIESFYTEAYGCRSQLVYEQGRGGGGASFDAEAGFPFHAHLCALPIDVDLHTTLAYRFTGVEISGLQDLPETAGDAPYLYIDGRDRGGGRQRMVYLPGTPAMRAELERSRLKPMIAELTGLRERGTWRAYAGDAELASLIARFAWWRRSASFGHDQGRDPLGQRRDRA